MSQAAEWKVEAKKKRIQRERERDVEKRWEDVIMKDGEGCAEWLKEAAMKKKLKQAAEKEAANVAPWIKEVQRKNSGLARKISDVKKAEVEAATE